MKKLDLFLYDNYPHRIISIRNNEVLIINCDKIAMPFWVDKDKLTEKLQEDIVCSSLNSVSADKKKIAYQRYHLIAPILPLIDDEHIRSQLITRISENEGVSKQTIRKYLCLFLVYQNIDCLAPCETKKKVLSQDEKNYRWALNKYYFSPLKHTLKGSYLMMLKEKYMTPEGVLKEGYPPFHRYRYFFNKTKNLQSFYISRNGLSNYQRNNRPLVGGGILEFANSIGIGMLDSTILDIYLVNEQNELVGRPILTACVDAYSGLCCGYALTWEGGFFSIKQLLHNIIADKVEWCKRFGVSIDRDDWNCVGRLPFTFVTDKGREYTSYAFEQLTDLGIDIINLPPFRPDLKSCVEKFFHMIQSLYKPHLKGKGVVEEDYQERGAKDYRKTACLTLKQFETILLKCILYYNTKRVVERFRFDKDCLIKPYANEIWNASLKDFGSNLITVDEEYLTLVLLPREKSTFTRQGLCFRKLYYYAEGFTNEFLSGGTEVIAYNPNSVAQIWLLREGRYIPFSLISKCNTFESFEEIHTMQSEKSQYLKSFASEETTARIALINDIEVISKNAKQVVKTDSIRRTRSKEKAKEKSEV